MGSGEHAPSAALSLRALFEQLVELDPSAREAFLCQPQLTPALRAQLSALLDADGGGDSVLRTPAAEYARRLGLDTDTTDMQGLIGSRAGSFLLTGLLGEGGSSSVFRAERASGEGVQHVALKLLRTGLYSPAAQARFRREQAILAQLTHPNIAQLVEAGVSANGVPHIAMEIVEGGTLLQFAARENLDVAQRLRLFLPVCRAVEAAHRALIVHRDLKPANVLVTVSGEPKVLDFGIAKLLDDDAGGAATQLVALTPGYAPPEQETSGPVTTAMDVYALGVLLGELLCGERLGASAPPASRRVAASSAPLPRGLPPRAALVRALRGDLDALLTTATDADPARRYRSAGLLGDDIERHLRCEPVTARAPTRSYRVRRFVRRHRLAVAAAALALLTLLGALALSLWQAERTARALRRAETVQQFLLTLFVANEPGAALDQIPDTRTLLARGVERARHELAADPPTQAALLAALTGVHRNLGLNDTALELAQQTLRLQRQLHGERHADTLQAQVALGLIEYELGRYEDALRSLQAGVSTARELGDTVQLAEALDGVGLTLGELARPQQAEPAQREALALRERERDSTDDSEAVELSLNNLAGTLTLLRRSDEAVVLYQRALALRGARVGAVHAGMATLWSNLGETHRRRGDCAAALDALRRAVDIDAAVYREPAPRTASHQGNLANVLYSCGDYPAAETESTRALALSETLFGPTHPKTANARANAGVVQRELGRSGVARQQLSQALTDMRAAFGPDHPQVFTALSNLGETELRDGNAAAAREHLGLALAGRRGTLGDDDPSTAATAALLALAEAAAGDAAGARRRADDALQRGMKSQEISLARLRLLLAHAELALQQGDAVAAATDADAAIAFARSQLAPHHPRLAEALLLRVRAGGDAAALLDEAQRIAERRLPETHALRRAIAQQQAREIP